MGEEETKTEIEETKTEKSEKKVQCSMSEEEYTSMKTHYIINGIYDIYCMYNTE